MIGIPIFITSFAIISYMVYSNNTIKTNKNKIITPSIIKPDNELIFPDIKTRDFYDQIEFEEGLPFVGSKMMGAIIKSIISRLGSVNGDVTYYIIEKSKVQKNIYFKWSYKKKEIKKTYNILINGL